MWLCATAPLSQQNTFLPSIIRWAISHWSEDEHYNHIMIKQQYLIKCACYEIDSFERTRIVIEEDTYWGSKQHLSEHFPLSFSLHPYMNLLNMLATTVPSEAPCIFFETVKFVTDQSSQRAQRWSLVFCHQQQRQWLSQAQIMIGRQESVKTKKEWRKEKEKWLHSG